MAQEEQRKYESIDVELGHHTPVVVASPVVDDTTPGDIFYLPDGTTIVHRVEPISPTTPGVVPSVKVASSTGTFSTEIAILRWTLWSTFASACFVASSLVSDDSRTTTFRTFLAFWVAFSGLLALLGSSKTSSRLRDHLLVPMITIGYILCWCGMMGEAKVSPSVTYVWIGGFFGHLMPFAYLTDLKSQTNES